MVYSADWSVLYTLRKNLQLPTRLPGIRIDLHNTHRHLENPHFSTKVGKMAERSKSWSGSSLRPYIRAQDLSCSGRQAAASQGLSYRRRPSRRGQEPMLRGFRLYRNVSRRPEQRGLTGNAQSTCVSRSCTSLWEDVEVSRIKGKLPR